MRGYGGRQMTSFRVWMGLAVTMLAIGVTDGILTDAERAVAIPAAVALAGCVALAWWRPLLAAGAVLIVCCVQAPLGDPVYDLTTPVYPMAAVIGMNAGRADGRRLVVAIALGALAVEVVIVAAGLETLADSIFAALFIVGLPVLVGRMFRSRSLLNTELRERARRLTADRQARADLAAAQERRRIAGELHDLVAHGVSAMTVQAEAARRLVRKGDPRAAEAIYAVEDGGRVALAELRRLLGVLRLQDADLALAPQPSLARAGALVERLRAEGVDVRLEVEGDRVPVGPGVDLAGYRIIEEALRAGARGTVTIIVHYGSRHVDVSILGVAPESADLVRLRERVRLFGGEIVPTRRGGVPALRAHLPLAGSAA